MPKVRMFFAVCYFKVFETTEPIFWTNFVGTVVMLLSVPELLDFKNIVLGSFGKLIST